MRPIIVRYSLNFEPGSDTLDLDMSAAGDFVGPLKTLYKELAVEVRHE
jgi:hypothetical protein